MEFIKTYQKENEMIAERDGLKLLRKTLSHAQNNKIFVPAILYFEKTKLAIEKIVSTSPCSNHHQLLGEGLATLHAMQFANFGFDHDNYIGKGIQRNVLASNWGEYFFQYRLWSMVECISEVTIKLQFMGLLEERKKSIIQLLNQEVLHPSLVHGDLWSGNVMFSKNDKVWLIDPAVYYADREVDIAMTELFGGFSSGFYEAYQHHFPLSATYELKKVIYNLYHQLNHLNLFGTTYLPSCKQAFAEIQQML